MAKNQKQVIAITLGDINGVGPEIVIKALSDPRMLNQVTPVIFGSSKTISYYRKLLKIDDFSVVYLKEGQEPNPKKINLVECWEDIAEINLGEAKKDAGEKALKALDMACDFLEKGHVHAVVTAPINKAAIQSETFNFPGHTEYFGNKFGGKPLMLMVADNLRIAVATGHVPINEVSALITQERIDKSIKKLIKSLKKDFGISKPRVAVLGLNPHAGEEGLLGKEEIDIIKPAINQFKEKGELVFGPFPADGFFGSGTYKKYDGILAMYHDQGLVPFKSLSFGMGVNYTAGLSIIRTSPDHGTGYDIAGQGQASETSMRSAIYLAADIIKNRDETEADID
jgi:4-hydroxythreonine-4-phosphate dehydrogenase